MNNIKQLLSKPLPSTRTGAFYNAFPYPTKISPEAIAIYIACFTKPGETILDTFGGSGSTGIAALLCEHPTTKMIELAEKMGVHPVWGKRNAVLYEIGTYGSFATSTLTSRILAKDFQDAVRTYINNAEVELESFYTAKDDQGKVGHIRYIIWTEIRVCPECGKEFSYFDCGTSRDPVSFSKTVVCPHCNKKSAIESCNSAIETIYDTLLEKYIVRKKREPAWVYGVTKSRKWSRAVIESDRELIQRIEKMSFGSNDMPRKIQWGELHRAGYHTGITHLHHFYTKRNYLVMYKLWELTEKYPEQIRNALQLLLLSYNAAHCTMMTRVVAKKNAKDFVLTGAQSGVLYISKLPVEKNILLGLKRKATSFFEVYKLLENCGGNIQIHNSSSENIKESRDSIDFVFTDPPFGDFIPYAEVNQINELWLKKTTDRNQEIIISPSQEKNVFNYQNMLANVFSEINRVLKPDHYAVAVFHAAKAKVWSAFEYAIESSALTVSMTSILDKTQSSFKQIVSEDSVQGDPLVLLQKSNSKGEKELLEDYQILSYIVNKLDCKNINDERRVYSLYINICLEQGKDITLDAKDVYHYVRNMRGGINNKFNEE